MSDKVKQALRSNRSLLILAGMCILSYAIAWWISANSEDSERIDYRNRKILPAESQERTEKHSPPLHLVQVETAPVQSQSRSHTFPQGTTQDRNANIQRFVAETRVIPKKGTPEQEYAWILPQGVRLAHVEQHTGRIPALQAGQSWPLRIEVEWDLDADGVALRPESTPLVLHVYRNINGQAVGQLSQFELPPISPKRDSLLEEPNGETRRPRIPHRDSLER
ncbi:MAG TPA: hypothetical protein PLZ57_12585 [Pseudobdellovibrionaceae bacterium]|nr:hypothetical protein [Pseudobdellovibrionaceae bacterium]